jgi:hypothetical protein
MHGRGGFFRAAVQFFQRIWDLTTTHTPESHSGLLVLSWYHSTVLQPVRISIFDTKIFPPLIGAGGIAGQLRSSLVSYPKKEKRAVGKKIERNRPDSRFNAIYGYTLAPVLIQSSWATCGVKLPTCSGRGEKIFRAHEIRPPRLGYSGSPLLAQDFLEELNRYAEKNTTPLHRKPAQLIHHLLPGLNFISIQSPR